MKQQKITRREFFKASIKRTLPILGAIALGPAVLGSCSSDDGPLGCEGSCIGTAQEGCA